MKGHVPLQQRFVRKLLLAHVALIRLFPPMQAHVHVEGTLLGETLVADAALVSPDACVRHHVFD